MAITNNGTNVVANALAQANDVSGYTIPTNTVFSDWEYKKTAQFAVAKSTVENATPSTTFTALIAACDTEMDTWSAEFVATNTVTSYHEVSDIVVQEAGVDFDNGVTQYMCTMTTYIKVA
jgi:hypothetical protein